MLKNKFKFRKCKKKMEKLFFVSKRIASFKKTVLVIGSQGVNKMSFEQYFSPFTMLLVEGSSETGLLRLLSNDIFWSLKFKKTSGRTVIFFEKMFKTEFKFRKCKKNLDNIFRLPCYFLKGPLKRYFFRYFHVFRSA